MTDSLPLGEVFAAVLREHRAAVFGCFCGWSSETRLGVGEHRAHVAERLAARFEELGIVADAGGGEIRVLVDRDLKDYPALRVPVFRLVGGGPVTPREELIEATARADYDYISGGDWEPWATAGRLLRQECEDRAEVTVDALLAHRRDLLLEALGGQKYWNPEMSEWHWGFEEAQT